MDFKIYKIALMGNKSVRWCLKLFVHCKSEKRKNGFLRMNYYWFFWMLYKCLFFAHKANQVASLTSSAGLWHYPTILNRYTKTDIINPFLNPWFLIRYVVLFSCRKDKANKLTFWRDYKNFYKIGPHSISNYRIIINLICVYNIRIFV